MAKTEPNPSNEFVSGERRVALTRVYLKMTRPNIDQNTRRKLADMIIALADGKERKSHPQTITDAQVSEMVWRNMQCIHHRCPMLLFGKQLAEELNEFFAVEE